MIMMISKNELRTRLKQSRASLSSKECEASSATIVSRLKKAIDWLSVTEVHCYEPISHLKEVDISSFILTLQSEQSNLKIYTSRKINDVWQIVSWNGNSPAPERKFDAIIVPMLGFDTNLHRIGYGGGYYDRFLATQLQAKKLGVCFEAGKIDQIPTEPYDVPLDLIITEKTWTSKKVYNN